MSLVFLFLFEHGIDSQREETSSAKEYESIDADVTLEQKLELPPCVDYNVETLSQNELDQKNLYPVPLNFNECIKVLQTSTFLKETLGPNMVQYLIQRDIELLKKEQAIHAAQRKSS